MSWLICEFHHLILDGRAVSGTGSLYNSRIDRRSVQIGTDDLMGFFIGIGKPAGNLRLLNTFRIRGKRKGNNSFISRLFFHFGIIYGPAIHPRWCSCFETLQSYTELFQGIGQIYRRLKAVRSGMGNGFPA